MAEKVTSEKITSSADFSAIWKAALVEFHANTDLSLANETKLLDLQNIDDLIIYLKNEYAEYDKDSASSSFTSAVKSSLGSLSLLLTVGDKAAGNMFPGGSQVLSALGIFLEAGIAVTKSFEDVAGLFAKIGESTRRMRLVSQEDIPPGMIPIYQAMLLTLLKICGLGIKITLRPEPSDEQTKEPSRKHRILRATRAARANVKEYVRQLTGGNSMVNELVKKLDELVDNEVAMMQAETMTGVVHLKAFSIKIQDLTLELGDTMSKLQSDSVNLSFRVTLVQQSQSRIEENTIDIKKAQTQQDAKLNQQDAKLNQHEAKLDQILQLQLQRTTNSGSGKQQNENQETKTSVSEEFKRWKKLAAALGVEGARESNKAFYERIRNERVQGTTEWILKDMAVQSWFQGENPFVVVSGNTGNGKTFIASRIVEELIANKPNTSNLDKAVAYFFCRKGTGERNSVAFALKSMAYDIAVSDKLFAKRLSDMIKEQKLQSGRPASDTEVIAAKMDSITAEYDSIVATSNAVVNQSTAPASESTSENDRGPRSSTASEPLLETEPSSPRISNMNSGSEVVSTANGLAATTVASDAVQQPGQQNLSLESNSETDTTTEHEFDPKLRRVSTAVLQDIPLDDEDEEATVWDIQRHWEQLFVQSPKSFEKRIYLVIDGLDECDETEAVALCAAINASAGAVAGRAALKVHVLLFMNIDRATMFESHALTKASCVSVSPATVTEDLDRFVRRRISAAWEKKLVHGELREDCRKAVLENCSSNFLKASLLVSEVTSLCREDAIRDSLSKLPETAKTTKSATLLVIKRLASQLDSYDREDFHDILAWVSCAQRELSLADLDALMTLRKPSGARILDLETKVRETYNSLFSVSGDEIFKQKALDQLVSSRLEFIKSTRVYKDATGIHAVVDHPPGLSVAQDVQAHDTINEDSLAVRRATANLRKNTISLSHTSIAEEIQKHVAEAGLADFTTASLQATVLLHCIQNLCIDETSQDEQTVELARRYCGLFLPEHLHSVKPSEVAERMRTRIGKGLIALLRNPLYIARWVESAERYLANDLLGKPDFYQQILGWLEDDIVQSALNDDEREWHSRAKQSPIATLFGGMAKVIAHRWLACLEGWYGYADFYGFLKTFQDTKDSPCTIHTASEAPGRAIQSASTTDILRVAESAGLQQDGRWFQRLGSTIRHERIRYDDDVQFEPGAVETNSSGVNSRPSLTYDDAVGMYRKALEMDSSDAVARSGMALALAAQEKYEDAAREAETAVDRFSEAVRNGEKSPNSEYSLLKYEIDTRQDYASFCMKAGNPDEAFRAYECAIRDLSTFDTNDEGWERMVSATASYFYDLTFNKKWADAELLLRRLNSHTHRSAEPFHMVYQYMAYNTTQLLQIGYYTKNLKTLTEFMNHALSSSARQDDDAAVASVVHTFANILFRLDNERVDEAVGMLEAVVGQNYTYDYIKGWAERELARHFLTRILQERQDDHWQAVARYVDKLIKLVFGDDSDPTASNTQSRDCGRMLAAWYQLNGLQSRAMQCVRSDVTLGIKFLSDTDPDNDTMAWHALMDSLLAVGDEKRAVAAVNMLRSGLFEDPKSSGKTVDVFHANDDSTARSDGDTMVGASNESSGESPEAQEVNALPSANASHAVQIQTVNISDAKVLATSSGPVIDDAHESPQGQESDISKSKEAAPSPGYPFFGCDGCCFDSIANDAPMWRCSYCIADFCENCHRLIMDNNMTGWNVCDSLHRHVYVPGVRKKYTKDMIKVGDEEMAVSGWVQDLRKDWGYLKAGN